MKETILDRAIGWLSPSAGLARMSARARLEMARGGWEGARTDWRGSSWRVEPAGANTGLYGDLPTLRNRARSLIRNNPLAKRSIDILVGHTIGSGIRPSFQTESKAQRKRLMDAWKFFVDTADARRQVDVYGLQEQMVRGMFGAGETLALREIRRRSGRATLSYLPIEGDQLDHNREGVFEGRLTRLGVSLEKEGHAPDGYWLYDQNPGDAILWSTYPYSRFVPAEGIIHLYRISRPGQVRGVSELASILPVARDLADYMESALVKARAEAAYVAFIRAADARSTTVAQRRETVNGADRIYGEMVPGMAMRLDPGEDVTFSQPTSNPNFTAFAKMHQRLAAVGAGVTYDQATGDLEGANYSSLKAGKIEFRVLVNQIRDLTIIPMLMRPMKADFITFARTFGNLAAVDERVAIDWIAPAFEPIDPLKEMQADILAVRTGRMTWDAFVASWGADPQEQIEKIAALNKELDALDVVLDTDPRRMSAGGQAQAVTPDAAPDEGAEEDGDTIEQPEEGKPA